MFQIHAMHEAIAVFARDTGHCPTEDEGLSVLVARNYLSRPPLDAWGNEYVYQTDGRAYSLKSYGADGQPGGNGVDADIERTFVCEPSGRTPN